MCQCIGKFSRRCSHVEPAIIIKYDYWRVQNIANVCWRRKIEIEAVLAEPTKGRGIIRMHRSLQLPPIIDNSLQHVQMMQGKAYQVNVRFVPPSGSSAIASPIAVRLTPRPLPRLRLSAGVRPSCAPEPTAGRASPAEGSRSPRPVVRRWLSIAPIAS